MAAKIRKPTDPNPKLVRDFLKADLPLIPSGTPTKPGPIHISNVLIAHALGSGSLKNHLPKLLKSKGELIDLLDSADPNLTLNSENLRKTIETVFDTDGNVFPKFSSPFPICREFVFEDSSDNGYAEGLWFSLGEKNRKDLADALGTLLSEDTDDHGLSNLISKLKQTELTTPGSPKVSTGSTPFGENIGKILVKGLQKGISRPMHVRIEILKQFSILLGAFVVIGMMYDSCSKLISSSKDLAPSDVLGTFCFTGNTAGRSNEERQLAQLAIFSLRDTIDRTYRGIEQAFNSEVLNRRKSFPKEDWSTLCQKLLTEKLSGESAKNLLDVLLHFGENGLLNLIPQVYPISNLRSAVKSLGHKCGVVWPVKSGEPRIVLDSVFVNSLVSFMGEPDMSLSEFTETIFEKLGLIFGYSGISDSAITKLEEITSGRLNIVDLLSKSEKHLSNRLVTAGLARQYSDGSAAINRSLL